MDWQPFESKLLTASAYNAGKRTLYLRFRSGDVYRYFEFQSTDFRAFLSAESRGRFFLAHIRDHFRFERMAKLHAA